MEGAQVGAEAAVGDVGGEGGFQCLHGLQTWRIDVHGIEGEGPGVFALLGEAGKLLEPEPGADGDLEVVACLQTWWIPNVCQYIHVCQYIESNIIRHFHC